ncbi:hypothetical protein ACVWYQ_003913 [Bradyrhizobium sp. USDA 3397]
MKPPPMLEWDATRTGAGGTRGWYSTAGGSFGTLLSKAPASFAPAMKVQALPSSATDIFLNIDVLCTVSSRSHASWRAGG